MRAGLSCTVGLALLFCAPTVDAQIGRALPLHHDLAKVPLGSYSTYRARAPNDKVIEMTMAVVGRKGRASWLEIAMKMPSSRMQMKMLIQRKGKGYAVGKTLVQMPGVAGPMEVPGGGPRSPMLITPDPKELVGSETVKVAAGAFLAKHYRRTVAGRTIDTWASARVFPLAVVKMTLTEKGGQPVTVMELLEQGKGRKSAITGEATAMPVPSGPPPGAKGSRGRK